MMWDIRSIHQSKGGVEKTSSPFDKTSVHCLRSLFFFFISLSIMMVVCGKKMEGGRAGRARALVPELKGRRSLTALS